MTKTTVRLLVPFALAALTACGRPAATSSTTGLANDGAGKNAAVIFGAPHNLPGVPTDVREFGNLLKDQQYDFRFDDVRANGDADASEILQMTGDVARDADTLIWFFSGHGNTGVMLAKDRTFTFHEVATAIKTARANKPLKRLIVFIDSCYSGSFIDGSSPIVEGFAAGSRAEKCVASAGGDAPSLFDTLMTVDRGIYEEAFAMASSTKDESSVDLGAEKGGAFTWSLRQVMANYKKTRDDASIDQFASATSERTYEEGGHTPVYKAFPSAAVLGEHIFHYAD